MINAEGLIFKKKAQREKNSMSAITGIYNLNDEPVNAEYGMNMMKALQKYPADDVQTWHKDNVFLGCHAQWITPESVGEKLPYYDQERKLAITADAIIDNRDELFNQLHIEHPYRKTMSDSELILLAYHKWGQESPKYLIGDFAFMIWDEKRHMLFGARDFAGNRTLYFYSDERRFAFCTVINPLFTLPYITKKLNEQWLAEYLAMPDANNDVLEPSSTVYKSIGQVPPAHSVSVTGGRVSLSRYCKLDVESKLKLKSDSEYEEAFCEVFECAVTRMLRSQHGIGALLSGGLDSGSVVSFAAKALRKEDKELHTFSYVPGLDLHEWTSKYRLMANEKPLIQSTVQYVGNIKDHYLTFEGKSSLSEIDDWLDIMEMPYKFFETSFWFKDIHEAARRQGMGVLLSGQGGNLTISWGPVWDYYALMLKKMRWISLYREIHHRSLRTGMKKARILFLSGKIAFPSLYRIFKQSDNENNQPWINAEFAQKTNVFEKIRDFGLNYKRPHDKNEYEMRKKYFMRAVSWDRVGTVVSRLSLRYSLWDRDPTNDLRVIRFCLSVPDEQYVKYGVDRSLIRRATKNYLPDQVRLNRMVGMQTAEVVHRLASSWTEFTDQIELLCKDPVISQFLNVNVIKTALSNVGTEPRPELLFNRDFKILGRSLIFHRFIKRVEGR